MASHATSPRAFAWMAGSACGFALMNFFAHVASREVHWSLVVFVRAVVGAGVAYGVSRARHTTLIVRDWRALSVRSVLGTASMLCTFYAVGSEALPLGDAVTLVNLTPVFLALLAPVLLGERGGRRVRVAIPLALAGLVLIVRPTFLFHGAALTPRALVAAAVAVAASLSASFAWAALRRLGPHESAEGITFWFSLLAALVGMVFALPHLTLPRGAVLLAMLGAGAAGGFAQLAITRAYALERAARLAGMAYLAVVVDALLGAVALHEWPPLTTLLGMAFVVSAGLVVTVASVREHAQAGRSSR